MASILIQDISSGEELVKQIAETVERISARVVGTATYEGTIQHSPETTVHIWQITDGGSTKIRLVFDTLARATYLSVQSDELGLESRILEDFRTHLQVVPLAQLLQDAARNGDADAQAYVRLALGSGGSHAELYREEIHRLLSQSLRSDNLNRRRGAALAMGLLLWPEFWDDIVEALETETDQANRSLLTVAYRQLAA